MSNVKSNSNKAPLVEAEESLDKYTEDFGGYSLNEGINASGGRSGLGYERPIDDSGIDRSAIKQRASLNINETATPIHVSQNSAHGGVENRS